MSLFTLVLVDYQIYPNEIVELSNYKVRACNFVRICFSDDWVPPTFHKVVNFISNVKTFWLIQWTMSLNSSNHLMRSSATRHWSNCFKKWVWKGLFVIDIEKLYYLACCSMIYPLVYTRRCRGRYFSCPCRNCHIPNRSTLWHLTTWWIIWIRNKFTVGVDILVGWTSEIKGYIWWK